MEPRSSICLHLVHGATTLSMDGFQILCPQITYFKFRALRFFITHSAMLRPNASLSRFFTIPSRISLLSSVPIPSLRRGGKLTPATDVHIMSVARPQQCSLLLGHGQSRMQKISLTFPGWAATIFLAPSTAVFLHLPTAGIFGGGTFRHHSLLGGSIGS